MTEDEARTKWCPMAYGKGEERLTNCIASDCMMWRWAERDELAQERWSEETLRKLERQGDCGLKR